MRVGFDRHEYEDISFLTLNISAVFDQWLPESWHTYRDIFFPLSLNDPGAFNELFTVYLQFKKVLRMEESATEATLAMQYHGNALRSVNERLPAHAASDGVFVAIMAFAPYYVSAELSSNVL
jgi:hypothetical protein